MKRKREDACGGELQHPGWLLQIGIVDLLLEMRLWLCALAIGSQMPLLHLISSHDADMRFFPA